MFVDLSCEIPIHHTTTCSSASTLSLYRQRLAAPHQQTSKPPTGHNADEGAQVTVCRRLGFGYFFYSFLFFFSVLN
jgi:hypothetical protein